MKKFLMLLAVSFMALTASAQDADYTMITGTDGLVDGETYLLAYGEKGEGTYQVLKEINTADQGKTADLAVSGYVAKSDDVKSSGAMVLTLVQNGGNWAFKMPDGDYLAYTDNKNKLNTSSTLDNKSTWTITFDATTQSAKINNVDQTNRYIQYNPNGGDPIVACYKNTLKNMFLFKASSNPVTSTFTFKVNGDEGALDKIKALFNDYKKFEGATGKPEFEGPDDNGVYKAIFEGTITGIDDYALSYADGLEEISIAENVTDIGKYVFTYVKTLKKVTIPESVKNIKDYAFYGCYGLTDVTIPATVTSIGDYAFFDTYLLSINYTGEATGYPWNATMVDTRDNGICIKDNVVEKYIGTDTDVTIPDGVTMLSSASFLNTNIETVVIPASVKTIDNFAFRNCTKLKTVTCFRTEDPITTIGPKTFMDCTSLSTIYVLHKSYFDYLQAPNWSDYKDIIKDLEGEAGGIKYNFTSASTVEVIHGDKPYEGDIVIPEEVEIDGSTYTVTAIGNDAFRTCEKLTSVTIPETVESIGTSAFDQCALKEITIPNSVKTIGDAAFLGCENLISVTIGSGIKEIGDFAFTNCTRLQVVNCLATTPPRLGGSAFIIFVQAHEGSILDDLFDIDDDDDWDLPGLDDLFDDLFDDDDEIHFVPMQKMMSILVPAKSVDAYKNDITWFEYKEFIFPFEYEVGGIKYELTSESTVMVVQKDEEYTGNVIIPAKVMIEGDPYNVTAIGDKAFADCKGITYVIIPESVKSIGNEAFRGCNFEMIIIPNSVEAIGEKAFYECPNLNTVTLGSALTSIGAMAFTNCLNLAIVNCVSEVPPTLETSSGIGDHFYYVKESEGTSIRMFLPYIVFYVPAGSLKDYMTKDNWEDYKLGMVGQIAMPESGMCTFSSGVDIVLPSGIKAFYASSADAKGVQMTEIDEKVPANTGVVLKGKAGVHKLFKPTTGVKAIKENYLVAVDTQTDLAPTTGSKTNYVLHDGKFCPFTGTATVKKGRAYLSVETAADGKLDLEFEGETTGVSHVGNVENVGNIYNLNGVRVNDNYKGVVIKNGKKILVK